MYKIDQGIVVRALYGSGHGTLAAGMNGMRRVTRDRILEIKRVSKRPSLVIAVVVASLPRVVTATELLCCCNPVYVHVGQPKVHRHWMNAVVHP